MARLLSVCKHFAHVNEQVVIEDMDLNVDNDGVVSVIFDVRPYKRHQRRCPHCGKRCPGYDSTSSPPRLWRALDCGGVLLYLRHAPGRIHCPEHGVVTSAVPWAFHGSGSTKEFDLQVARLAKYLPRSSIESSCASTGKRSAAASNGLNFTLIPMRTSGVLRDSSI